MRGSVAVARAGWKNLFGGGKAEEEDEMCREKIDLTRKRSSEEALAKSTNGADGDADTVKVTFLGAEGARVTIDCPTEAYVLDAGIDSGLELPFSCRGGICGACVGRVTQGDLDQSDVADLSFCLEDEQIEDGLALLCMARPTSDCVIETQSDWGYSLGVKEWQGPTGYILGKEVNPISKG